MSVRDARLLKLSDLAEAVGLLTRLPVRLTGAPRGAQATWAYPLAGLVVGAIGALVAWLTSALPPALTAGFTLAAMTLVTGALHEDGLADTADGLWGGWTVERRLEIMKDSRIGAYGVLALIFGIGLRWSALAALASEGALWPVLLAVGMLSRAPMVVLMHGMPNARGSGLSASTGRPPRATVLLAVVLATLGGAATLGPAVLPAILVLALVTLGMAALARAKIGGQTGDILGATQQVSEIALLALLTLSIPPK